MAGPPNHPPIVLANQRIFETVISPKYPYENESGSRLAHVMRGKYKTIFQRSQIEILSYTAFLFQTKIASA
ncbi:MAG: hypothetical protein C5B47_01235 [Verrucomicrobia bacterium]|nr:MAG: hypothetical protein C5B47_01235 [Verrucomicrobiota bacterium]